MPILRTKKALAALKSGQMLKIVATDPGAPRDFGRLRQADGKRSGASRRDFQGMDVLAAAAMTAGEPGALR
jgi:tRNA 2-thiouridine synthesizing protein A